MDEKAFLAMAERFNGDRGAVYVHGFNDLQRDYVLELEERGGDREVLTLIGCVELQYRSALSQSGLGSIPSWDQDQNEVRGYDWSVRWADLYPGIKLIQGGSRAEFWSRHTGARFHEATIEGNVFSIRLVFFDFTLKAKD